MQALKRPARNGLLWLIGGFKLVRGRPAAMMAIVAAYWFVVLFVSALPYLGSLLASLIMPALSVGVMNACRRAEAGETPRLDVLISALRGDPKRTRNLLAMGALYLSLSLVVLYLTSLVDGGTLMGLMTGRQVSAEELQAPAFQTATQLALALMAPILMAWWYAPMLVSWHGLSIGKALVFSFIASWRNWRAFLVYGLAAAAFSLPLLYLAALAMMSAAVGQASSTQILFMFAILVLAPVYFASFYVTYRDVFTINDDAPGASPEPTGGNVDTEA